MKKLLMLFALVGFVGIASVSAQSCPYSSVKQTGDKKACCAKTKAAAAKAASMDTNIEERVCEKSGKVSYVKKSVCAQSGHVSYSDVEYCSKSAKFVNVSPSAAAPGKTCTKAEKAASCQKKCTKAEKAACSKSASATKTAATGKSCTKAAAGKSCCKSKGAKTCTKSAKATSTGTAKMVKHEDNQ